MHIRIWIAICLIVSLSNASKVRVAAASDLKYALDDIIHSFERQYSTIDIEVVYGSSGKLSTQVQQGAPYDLFLSADIAYPQRLADSGFAASEVFPFAIGRIVVWRASITHPKWTLDSLVKPHIRHIAIANPKHAPYGKRAVEAMKAVGIWNAVESKTVYGENVAHAAQFVRSGNADVGIIALSLALSPELAKSGSYVMIPDSLHLPLQQGFIITKQARDTLSAQQFSAFLKLNKSHRILEKYGFTLPKPIKE